MQCVLCVARISNASHIWWLIIVASCLYSLEGSTMLPFMTSLIELTLNQMDFGVVGWDRISYFSRWSYFVAVISPIALTVLSTTRKLGLDVVPFLLYISGLQHSLQNFASHLFPPQNYSILCWVGMHSLCIKNHVWTRFSILQKISTLIKFFWPISYHFEL